jgi:ornithine cyclodeaminase/alanine dehydrogenase-like protein (mu-crystallin family)
MAECIALMSDALTTLARGDVHQPLRTVIRPPGAKGLLALMPAYRGRNQEAFGLKAITVFPGNSAFGKDAHQGAVLLFDVETGELVALVNASAITALRTAAVSAVATDLLAREDASSLTIIGAGVQARTHLHAIASVRSIKHARVVCRTPAHAQRFANDMQSNFSFPIETARSVEEALSGADIVVTATTSLQPVLKKEWLSPGTHINAIGTHSPDSREIDSATMAIARIFVDRRESALNESGDYLLAVKEGVIDPEDILAEIGELLIGTKPGRTSPSEITLFKSLGLAIEDVACAEYLFRRARAEDVGSWVNF